MSLLNVVGRIDRNVILSDNWMRNFIMPATSVGFLMQFYVE